MSASGRGARTAATLGFAALPWAVCGTVMMVGRQVTSLDNALVIHALVVPVAFGAAARAHSRRYPDAAPLRTAAAFLGFALVMDALVVAPVLEHSYAMFASVPGTWVPFALIFGSVYVATAIGRPGRGAAGADPSRRAA